MLGHRLWDAVWHDLRIIDAVKAGVVNCLNPGAGA